MRTEYEERRSQNMEMSHRPRPSHGTRASRGGLTRQLGSLQNKGCMNGAGRKTQGKQMLKSEEGRNQEMIMSHWQKPNREAHASRDCTKRYDHSVVTTK